MTDGERQRQRVIDAIVRSELRNRKLSTKNATQLDVCKIAAVVDLTLVGPLKDDESTIRRAWAMAKGLFGPAFEAADEAHRGVWIDLCERALREEAEARQG